MFGWEMREGISFHEITQVSIRMIQNFGILVFMKLDIMIYQL